jgi:hypothetical protein
VLARRMAGGAAHPTFSCFKYARLSKRITLAIAILLLTVCVWASYSAILAVPGLPAGQRVRASRRLRQETKLLILKKLIFYFNVLIKYISLLILERYLTCKYTLTSMVCGASIRSFPDVSQLFVFIHGGRQALWKRAIRTAC